MDRWMERLGYVVQIATDALAAAAGTAADQGAELAEDFADEIPDGDALEEALGGLADGLPVSGLAGVAATAAAGWLGSRVLGAREVRWGRAVLAGVIGTMLYDIMMLADQRLLQRNFDTIRPLGEALTDNEELQPWLAWAAHYAAGVGLAVVYARYLRGRLPGPPVAQGVAFGLLDAATLAWGGVYPLLSRAVPGVRIPPGYAGLAHAPTPGAQSLLRHAAYGAGVGMVYGEGE